MNVVECIGHSVTTVEGRGHALELSVAAHSSGVYFFAIGKDMGGWYRCRLCAELTGIHYRVYIPTHLTPNPI